MMDIGKYFSRSKKGNLSDNSKEATDPKKAKETTSSASYSDHDILKKVWTLQAVEIFFLIA